MRNCRLDFGKWAESSELDRFLIAMVGLEDWAHPTHVLNCGSTGIRFFEDGALLFHPRLRQRWPHAQINDKTA